MYLICIQTQNNIYPSRRIISQREYFINNKSTKKFKAIDWDRYRNHCVGFIFQNYNLIPHISILDNVEMGMTLSGVNSKTRKKKAKDYNNKNAS